MLAEIEGKEMIKNEPNKSLKQGPKFSQEQYDMIKRCSDKKDMTEWNKWREGNRKKHINLNKANLDGAYLERANLNRANLGGAKLRGAVLWEAQLQQTNLRRSFLQGADFRRTQLQGTEFGGAKLQEADFSRAIVDGETLIWDCEIDKKTKFEGVGLGNIRIYPEEKQLLEYNIRRMNWNVWYTKRKLFRWPVQIFWQISDYGFKTWPIIALFFGLAFLFALIYYFFPNCVRVYGVVGDIRGFLHTLYFSVVTMTTLGFGDIAANPDSQFGQVLLMFQVILGYVLLGSLITRFAVLFTAGAPAGSFTPIDEKTKQLLAEVKRNRKV
jgi:uncharacterized protein YjbI with pentapeptide repeats